MTTNQERITHIEINGNLVCKIGADWRRRNELKYVIYAVDDTFKKEDYRAKIRDQGTSDVDASALMVESEEWCFKACIRSLLVLNVT